MKLFMTCCAAIFISATTLITVLASTLAGEPEAGGGGGPQVGHMVFFDLKENTPKARERLLAACKEHLADHEGTVYFSVGALAEDLKREVNDLDFHVALHLVFENKAAHDRYQTHKRHLKFIEEQKELWKRVRVFDSYLSAPAKKST